jgi:uncharacterized protein YsxB (DUF464 family)
MVQIYYTTVGGELRVDMKGHGDLENIEQLDVMCAATTTLANTLSLNVMTAHKLGWLDEEPTVYVGDDGEGMARILCKPKPEVYYVVKTMFETIATGFGYLAALYPANVAFIKE